MSIVDSETLALSLGLRVSKLVNAFYCLSNVSTNGTHDLEELILIEALWDPEGDVLVAGGEPGVRFELGDLPLLELADESCILTPEQSDVLDVEELHSPAFQPKTECPSYFLLNVSSCSLHDLVMNDSRSQNL